MKRIMFIAVFLAAILLPLSGSAKVIYTGELAKKVVGYNGPTPLSITVENNRIVDIKALDNDETPRYFKKAFNKIAQQYIGKTLDEAMTLEVDAVSGATYSSDAIIKNIKAGVAEAKKSSKATTSKKKSKKSRRR